MFNKFCITHSHSSTFGWNIADFSIFYKTRYPHQDTIFEYLVLVKI